MRNGAVAAGVTALALGVGIPTFAANNPDPSIGPETSKSQAKQDPTLAERAGITKEGTAYAGWRDRATRGSATDGVQAATPAGKGVKGIDVASHQGNVAWKSWRNKGYRWAFVKATEGTGYRNPYFAQQYNGSYKVGMIRGAYHFALPNKSSGAAQARYFVKRGGGWSADGKTLPGALDIEYNPYGSTCYGKSQKAMVAWIKDFTTTYKKLTGRQPVIYTAANWWKPCTGNSKAFATKNPAWIADIYNTPPKMFGGWGFHSFHQYSSAGGMDRNTWNGSWDRLKVMAKG